MMYTMIITAASNKPDITLEVKIPKNAYSIDIVYERDHKITK